MLSYFCFVFCLAFAAANAAFYAADHFALNLGAAIFCGGTAVWILIQEAKR